VTKARRMRWGGKCSTYGETSCIYRVLVGKPEGKRTLEKSGRRWENNNKKDLQKVGCGVMDWLEMASNRNSWRPFVNAVMNLRILSNVGNFLAN
jgi:hypothetical protein